MAWRGIKEKLEDSELKWIVLVFTPLTRYLEFHPLITLLPSTHHYHHHHQQQQQRPTRVLVSLTIHRIMMIVQHPPHVPRYRSFAFKPFRKCMSAAHDDDDDTLVYKYGESEGVIFMAGNHIRDKGVAWIVDAFKEPCCREYYKLYLCDNRIGRLGASCLSRALNFNKTLIELSLGNNLIGDEGVEYLAKALMKNGTLEMLNLEKNNVGPIGTIALANALENYNTSLKWLMLSENPLGDEGVTSLLRCVGNVSSFECIQNCNHFLQSVIMRKITQVKDSSTATIKKIQSYLKINRLSIDSTKLAVQRKLVKFVRENHRILLGSSTAVPNRDGLKEMHYISHILSLLGDERDLSTIFALLKNTPHILSAGPGRGVLS